MTAFFRIHRWAIASGILLALAFPRWGLFPLAWVALTPLLAQAGQEPPRRACALFFTAGLVFYLILLHWLMTNVYWAGGWAFWGYVALCALMAAYWGIAGTLWIWTRARLGWFPAAVSLAILWAAMEHLQGILLTGFGWGSIAYSQGPNLWVVQWASIGGMYLISALVAAVNALLAQTITVRARRLLHGTTAIALAVGAHAAGYALMAEPVYGDKPFRVGMLQADFPLEMKWDAEYTVEMVRSAAAKSRLLAGIERVDLIVWPESLIMADIDTPEILDEVCRLTRDTGAALFAGSHRASPTTGMPLNSSFFVRPDGVIGDYYDKQHLAPFGEYVPLSKYLPFIQKIVPAIGDLEAGAEPKVIPVNGRNLGPLICFEVLFPEMAGTLRGRGADFLTVITNLGWFGQSCAIPQELEIARLRAIETRLPLVHCANTGVSGVFDPWGRFACADMYFFSDGTLRRVVLSSPYQTVMNRFAGVAPLAEPASRPIPWGPGIFPWATLAAAGLLILGAAIPRRGGSSKQVRGGAR